MMELDTSPDMTPELLKMAELRVDGAAADKLIFESGEGEESIFGEATAERDGDWRVLFRLWSEER